jgi:non-specific serine/threonine protein kinase
VLDSSIAPVPAGQVRLPAPLTTFVGRERELSELAALVAARRLLTLTGPGGSGKTRLSVEVARRVVDGFPDGVVFVSLAPLADPRLVASAIATALDISELSNQPAEVSLKRSIGERRMLLVLDNFEHLLTGASLVVDLLTACPGLTVLATSREVLRLSGEHVYAVPPLSVPDLAAIESADDDADAIVAASEAVRLFVDRARGAQAGFRLDAESARAVAALCVRLDGLPLAVELAAARVRLLSPRAMAARMEGRLALLTGGPRDLPARQRTLRDTIAWSYDLLTPEEQRLFRTLAIFAGGCTLEAIERVASSEVRVASEPVSHSLLATHDSLLNVVESLVDKSLVRQIDGPDGEPRLWMLETLREFAVEQLQAHGELSALRDRHLAYYLAFAEETKPKLLGPEQAVCFDRLERENDNFRAALERSYTEGSEAGSADVEIVPGITRVEAGIRLAVALGFYWVLRGRGRENLPRVMALLALAPPGTTTRAQAVTVAAHVSGHMLGQYQIAVPLADEGVQMWRVLDDAYGLAVALLRRGQLAFETGDYALANALLSEARDRFRDLGQDAGPEVPTACWMAEVAQAQGDPDRAIQLYDQVLPEARARGDSHVIAHCLREVARLRRKQGDPVLALSLLQESAVLYVPIKDVRCACILLEDLAGVLCDRDRPAEAVRLFAASEALREIIGRPLTRSQIVTHDRDVEAAKQRLGPEEFEAAWSAGRVMSWEQAVAYAARLEDGSPSASGAQPRAISTRADGFPELTPRELDVVRLLARGLSNPRIAAELVISKRTVGSHVYRLMGKLGCATRAQVAALAVARGLADFEPGPGD